jgi:hypothetical protein
LIIFIPSVLLCLARRREVKKAKVSRMTETERKSVGEKERKRERKKEREEKRKEIREEKT